MDLTQLGKTPIEPDLPGGADVRYDPDFETVQAEIDKLTSPTASGQVDWERVAEISARLLETKSKDLTLAGYLAVALLTTRQIPGLDQGVIILKEMLETFWDTLYPSKKRMRGRAGAITWWVERTESALEKLSPTPQPADLVTRLQTNLHAMDALLAEKMPDAPLLRSLQRRIEALPVEKSDDRTPDTAPAADPAHTVAAAPPSNATAPPQASAPPPEPTAGTDPPDSAADARRAADSAMQRLRQVSLFLLQNDLTDPLAYRYRRMAGWARVTGAPPANNEGNTQIAPPPPQVVAQMETLRAAGNLPNLILNAEPKTSQFLFWFDLHRTIAEALGDLDDTHHAARDAVCQETAGLLGRLPDLAPLRFSDGMPFADPQTRQWLQHIGGTAGGGFAALPAGQVPTDADPMEATVRKAGAMARKKNVIEAVDLLQREMRRELSRHLQLRWRLAIARLLLENKKAQAALPHVEQILSDIDRFELETWDPDLAVEALLLAWQGFGAQSGHEFKTRAAQVLHRTATVNPAAALRAAP